MIKTLFSPQGRLKSLPYAIWMLVLLSGMFALKFAGSYISARFGAGYDGILTGVYLAYYLLPLLATLYRCRDAGVHPGVCVLMLCPFVNLALILFLIVKKSVPEQS